MLALVLPYPPSANVMWRNYRGHVVESDATRKFKRDVSFLAIGEGIELIRKPATVRMIVRVYRPLKRGDLSNRIKVLEDSLEGIAYENDDQIVELHAYRYDDKARPRVEVEVERIWINGER